MLFWIWCTCIVVALVLYYYRTYSKFSRFGVKSYTPLPVIGNMYHILCQSVHFTDIIEKSYKDFAGEKFVGAYMFSSPVITVYDLELIKQLSIKDFEHFLDRRVTVNKENDSLFGRNMFSLKGDEWKDMRATLSPAFTSSKIRAMVPFMVEVGDQMIKAIAKKIQATEDGSLEIDVKDLTTRYGTDVIASCAFGLKVDSHNDEENQFYTQGKAAADFGFKALLIFFGYCTFPKIMNAFKLSLFSPETRSFFCDLVKNTMQERERRHIVRPDMIHLLMEAKNGQLRHVDKGDETDTGAGFATVEESAVGKKMINRAWTDDDLTAQAILFFIAGFETVSSAMSFLLYELAVNPDVQDKLVREIRENDDKNNGKFDYNSVQRMKYMDMVVSELLRKWPPVVALDRMCTKDYNIGRPNDKATKDYIIRKGEGISIPAWAFHRNPEFFPDPVKFDPERFSDENKHNIKPFTYMPFGVGPRNCIGSRFALCEVKVMVYQLIRSMEVTPSSRTVIPAQLSKDSFNNRMVGGHWLRFRARK